MSEPNENRTTGNLPAEQKRHHLDIEQDFIPAINTVKAICDLLTEATQQNGGHLPGLLDGTLYALADRCLIEATKAGDLFYELQDSVSDRIQELETQLEEPKPEQPELETEGYILERSLAMANEAAEKISERLKFIQQTHETRGREALL